MSSFPDVDVYRGEVSMDFLGERDFKGGYNAGYRVDAGKLYDRVEAVDGDFDLGGELVDDPDEYVLWVPLDAGTPVMDVEEDVMSYHVARAKNAENMREEGLNVPDVGILGSDLGSFLVTPYVSARQEFVGDRQRNNPHRNGPVINDDREFFHDEIRDAKDMFPAEELVNEGRYVDAGNGFFDEHKDNWGLRGTTLVRFDLGEIPGEGQDWNLMPYDGPEEFYEGEGIRDVAGDVLGDLGIDPGKEISEEYRALMEE